MMNKKTKHSIFIYYLLPITCYLLPVAFCFLILAPKSLAKVNWQKTTVTNRIKLAPEMSMTVTATVDGYLFNLEGLTSPWARVEFFSTEGNVKVFTTANKDGVFRFHSVMAPIQTGDFCFLSYDINQIANNPLCFPPPPAKTETTISGIILSPTVFIEKSLIRQNETVAARGRSFPNAELEVFFFEVQRNPWREFFDVIFPAVFAREGPKLAVQSNNEGVFSFNLPTQKSTQWRFFVGPKINGLSQTAKSNTLTFQALSWWQYMLLTVLRLVYRFFKALWSWLTKWQVLVGLLIASIGIIVYKIKREGRITRPL